MSKLITVALVIVPLYLGSAAPAAAWGCRPCGYGYAAAPYYGSYGYTPSYGYGYRPSYGYYGYRPSYGSYGYRPSYGYYGQAYSPYYRSRPSQLYGGYFAGPRTWGWRGYGYRSGWRGYGPQPGG